MGVIYYLVSPTAKRVLDCDKLAVYVDDAGMVEIKVEGAGFVPRAWDPRSAVALHVWLDHYGGPGLFMITDASDWWDDKGEPFNWTEWPEDDLFELRDWLFGD